MEKTIERPSAQQLKKYLKEWDNLENYKTQENALDKIFTEFPNNNNIEEVLIKVTCLNSFYSTNIYDTYSVSKYITSLKIDKRLKNKDLTVVNEIAKVPMKNGSVKNFYSFATKYCSHHFDKDFPIYDSYVDKMLHAINKQEKFGEFKRADLKDYVKFNQVLCDFRKYFNLDEFSLKEIDMYLWQAGKKYFPKNF
jgi:hypothetical protein